MPALLTTLHNIVQVGLLLSVFNNSALVLQQQQQQPSSTKTELVTNTSRILMNNPTAATDDNISTPYSASLEGTFRFASAGTYTFNCSFDNFSFATVHIGDHMVCNGQTAEHGNKGSLDNPLQVRDLPVNGLNYTVRAQFWSYGKPSAFSLTWCRGAVGPKNKHNAKFLPLPPSRLSPHVNDAEKQRRKLNDELTAPRWTNFYRSNPLTLAHLPDGFTITPKACNTWNATPGNCITNEQIQWGTVVPGMCAADQSYCQFFAANGNPRNGGKLPPGVTFANYSISFSSVSSKNNSSSSSSSAHLYWAMRRVGEQPWPSFAVEFVTRFAWFRGGTIDETNNSKLIIRPSGLPEMTLFVRRSDPEDRLVTLSTDPSLTTAEEVLGFVEAKRKKHVADLNERFGNSSTTSLATGLEAATTFNTIFNPYQYPSVFVVVSRGWAAMPHAVDPDWLYVLFAWDSHFASLLAALIPTGGNSAAGGDSSLTFSKKIAFSTVINIVKEKTSSGVIPNFAGGGYKSTDRGEPPLAAKTLFELHAKFGDDESLWLLELLFDNAADQNDYFYLRAGNCTAPDGRSQLICLNSWDPQPEHCPNNTGCNNMQDARYASGMDNSPMYDCRGDADCFFNNKSVPVPAKAAGGGGGGGGVTGPHQMELYDVGFSALVAMEARYLDKLATIVLRARQHSVPDPSWKQREAALVQAMNEFLWDPEREIYSNKFPNGSFYRAGSRYAPTSFYPLLVDAANDDQLVVLMQKWLLSPDAFCVSANPDVPFEGNHPDCWYGLPSIQRGSSQYLTDWTYWRGNLWSPTAMLVWWGLSEAASASQTRQKQHSPEVRALVGRARASVANQLKVLFLEQWDGERIVCETYCSPKNGGCCGDRFYVWGGLMGGLSVLEEGRWK